MLRRCLWMAAVVVASLAGSAVPSFAGAVGWSGNTIEAWVGGAGPSNGAEYHLGQTVLQAVNATAGADICNQTHDASGCTTTATAQESCDLTDWPGNQPAATRNGFVMAFGPVDFSQTVVVMFYSQKMLVWDDLGEHTAWLSGAARATGYTHGDPPGSQDTEPQELDVTANFTVVVWGGMGGGMGMMSAGDDEGDLDGLLEAQEQS